MTRTLKFTKMHGCGNDYVYFDCFNQTIEDPEALSIRLSDRHKGVGGDGIILVCPSDKADGKMRIFNADGSEAMMCGNGIRCVAKFLYDTGLCRKKHLEIDTLSGVKYCDIIEKDGEAAAVTVDMGRAELVPARIPVDLPGERVVGRKVSVAGGEYTVTCVSMGNPHCVVFGGTSSARPISTVISKELWNWTDTYTIDVMSPDDGLYALMFVLAIDAEKCSRN